MDCKRALESTSGNIDEAFDYLRKQGHAQAEQKQGRATEEGLIHSYVHAGNRLGVLVEVNCETDFVAKTPQFNELVSDIALQVAASGPKVISRDKLPPKEVKKESEIFREQALLEGKPEQVIDKIVEGRLEKYYQEVCLEEQAFIKDPSRTVSDLLTEAVGKLGENISIRRFVRFHLGEDSEQK